MALKESGIRLVTEAYDEYLQKLKNINKAHREAFSTDPIRKYDQAIKRSQSQSKKMADSSKSTWDAVSNLRSKLDETTSSSKKFGRSFGGLSNTFGSINSALRPVIGNVGDLTGKLVSLASKFTLVTIALKVISDLLRFGKAAIEVAQRNETLRVSLVEIGESAGYSMSQIDLATGLLKEQGITTSSAQQSLLKMARANISWAEASKLAAIAQGSAVVAGMNSSQAFERLVTGIQKMEPELLDELGITLNRTKAYEKFSATLGKNSKQLTDAEKQQAILNEIYKQSESVIGVYDAAMETSGKKQGSLARKIEETQNNLGQLLLPFQEINVEMKTNFWNAAQQVTKGLTSWITPLMAAKDALLSLNPIFGGLQTIWNLFGKGMGDRGFWDKLGEGIFNFGKIFTMAVIAIKSATAAVATFVSEKWNTVFEGLKKGFSGDFVGAAKSFKDSLSGMGDIQGNFSDEFNSRMKKVLEDYPDLMKSWAEVTQDVVGDSEDLRLAQDNMASSIEDATESIKEQITALEATKGALEKAEDIQKNYQKSVAEAGEEYQKSITEATEQHQEKREQLEKDHAKKLAEFIRESALERSKMVRDFNDQMGNREKEFNLQKEQTAKQFALQQKQNERTVHDTSEKELKRHLLSMEQARRRQSLSERRLMAEGDVLGLMEARENFALQQQEAQENFDFQKDESKGNYEEQKRLAKEGFKLQEEMAKQSFDLQTQIQKQEFEKRLADYDQNVAMQKEKMIQGHQEELVALDEKFEEEKTKLYENYQEKLAMLEENRQEQYSKLGESLEEQGKLTEEGMEAIAEILNETFGEEAGTSLMQGWSDSVNSVLGDAIAEIEGQIEGLKKSLEEEIEGPSITGGPRNARERDAIARQASRGPQNMRQGGVGVVTGPALFAVEPGQTEAFAFMPLQKTQKNVTVSGSADINLKGAEKAGTLEVSAAVRGMKNIFTDAIDRLEKQG